MAPLVLSHCEVGFFCIAYWLLPRDIPVIKMLLVHTGGMLVMTIDLPMIYNTVDIYKY